eukprot:3787820-Pleurochrysis_carterae.AAC.4
MPLAAFGGEERMAFLHVFRMCVPCRVQMQQAIPVPHSKPFPSLRSALRDISWPVQTLPTAPAFYHRYKGEQHGFRKAENIVDALNSELYFYSKVSRQPNQKINACCDQRRRAAF